MIIRTMMLSALLLSGCMHDNDEVRDWSNNELPNQLSAQSSGVGKASKSVVEVASKQTDINNIIGKETTDIKNASGNKFDKNTNNIYGQIKSSNQLISQLVDISNELNSTKEGLVLAERSASDMRDANASLVKENVDLAALVNKLEQKLDESTKKFLNKLLALLITLGVVMVGISGYVAWGAVQAGQNPLKAGGIAVAGMAISASAIGYMYHSETIGKIILIVIIIAVASLLYKIYIDYKDRKGLKEDIDLKGKTIEYATQLTEQLKEEVLTPEEKVEWFGNKHSDGKAGLLQRDERIKRLIHETRKHINELDSTTVK